MDDTTKSSRRKLLYSMLVGGLLLTLLTVWGFLFFKQQRQEDILYAETCELGRCLYLFVEDNGRMPRDRKELLQTAYLKASLNGSVQLGPRITGRDGALALPHYLEDVSFRYFDSIKVRYGDQEPSGDLLWVDSNHSAAAGIAKRYSEIIAERLSHFEKSVGRANEPAE